MSENDAIKPRYETPVVVPLGALQKGSAEYVFPEAGGDVCIDEAGNIRDCISGGVQNRHGIEEYKAPGFTW